jgi:aminopeptidase YwaD
MRNKTLSALFLLLLISLAASAQQQATDGPSAARLQQHISYLASDALNGRRTGTQGANDAAHYVAGEFARLGLQPTIHRAGASRRGSIAMSQYLQPFPYVAGVELGQKNTLILGGKRDDLKITLKAGEDWTPLGFSSNATISGSVSFVGFGITASELKHDDYAGGVAKGRIALALQGTPDGENPHGQFGRFEGVRWKAIAAKNAGAVALIVIAKDEKFTDDRLYTLSYDNSAGDAGLPVILMSRESANRMLGTSNLSLADVERAAGPKQLSEELMLTTDIVRKEVEAYNVIAVLEGSDRLLKNETIVIGAHYDHLGRGGEGSLAPRSGEIHHGADDNASGTAGVLELARLISAQKPRPKRTIVFICFSGEEEGLLGSNYYVNHPARPLANTVAMINMDMIGRMKDNKLIVGGVGTAKEWRQLLGVGESTSSATSGPFSVTLQEDGYGPSDHSSFYSKQIPVLFFWTGTHNDYHKPSDTFDKINYNDEARILSFVANVVRDVDNSDKRLTYTVAKSDSQPGRSTGFRVYLGTIPNYSDSNDGLLLDGVRDDSPAAKAGIKAGDKIVKIGTREIKNVYDYTYALGEMKAGEEYAVELVRGGERLTVKIKPEARK